MHYQLLADFIVTRVALNICNICCYFIAIIKIEVQLNYTIKSTSVKSETYVI